MWKVRFVDFANDSGKNGQKNLPDWLIGQLINRPYMRIS